MHETWGDNQFPACLTHGYIIHARREGVARPLFTQERVYSQKLNIGFKFEKRFVRIRSDDKRGTEYYPVSTFQPSLMNVR